MGTSSVKFVEENGVFQVTHIKELLELRLARLSSSGSLRSDENFGEKIFLCFSGNIVLLYITKNISTLLRDKGGLSTKVCVSIGNVDDPNSVDNQMLVGIYDGDDKAGQLRKAFSNSVFHQINEISELSFKYEEVMQNKQVQWYV